MAKVLYISYDGLTDPLGQSQVLPYLERLSAEGHEIAIVSFEKPQRYPALSGLIQAQCTAAQLEWIPQTYHKWPPIISTIYDLLKLRSVIRRRQRRHPVDIVHCRSYVAALAGVWMKRRFGTKFIFDMRGFWPDERVEGNIWDIANPAYRIVYQYFKKKERQFLTDSDVTVSLTENAKLELSTWALGGIKVSVIPTCVDLNLFDPGRFSMSDRLELRKKLGFAPNDFILIYVGSWGTWYQTELMVSFFKDLRARQPNARFLIVTPDKPTEANNIATVVSATRDEMPGLLSISDLSVMFIKPSYSKKASSATKLGEILAMGIPVITNPGWGDIDSYQQLLPEFIRFHTSFLATPVPVDPGRARLFCRNHLSLDMATGRYASIYNDLSPRKNP